MPWAVSSCFATSIRNFVEAVCRGDQIFHRFSLMCGEMSFAAGRFFAYPGGPPLLPCRAFCIASISAPKVRQSPLLSAWSACWQCLSASALDPNSARAPGVDGGVEGQQRPAALAPARTRWRNKLFNVLRHNDTNSPVGGGKRRFKPRNSQLSGTEIQQLTYSKASGRWGWLGTASNAQARLVPSREAAQEILVS